MHRNVLSLFIFVFLCPFLFANEGLKAPEIKDKSEKTQHLLEWSEKAFTLSEERPKEIGSFLKIFEKIQTNLESVPIDKIHNNKSFFGDIQKIKLNHRKVLYKQGVYALSQNEKKEKLIAIKEKLESIRAEDELIVPLLLKTGHYEDYYKKYRKILEVYDSNPNKLLFKPEIPPYFEIHSKTTINTLHDMVAIYDLCKKNYWSPSKKLEEEILYKISKKYKDNDLPSYALATLILFSEENQDEVLKKKKLSLQKIIDEESENTGNQIY